VQEISGKGGNGEVRNGDFPIVAIGASAGGLDAFRKLFAHLSDDTGMAFVVIQHLDPDRPSMLSTVLAGDVEMPVIEVTDGLCAEPDRVYVIPPGADLGIEEGIFTLAAREKTRRLHLPIDSFFRALAAERSSQAIGVVLSGSASDGTQGLRAIKAAGGITFAQEPASAQFPSMPESAIAAGIVDFRSPPEAIADELVRLSGHPYLAVPDGRLVVGDAERSADGSALRVILTALHQQARLDFSGYKRPTLMRRIARRMALRRVGSLDEYARSVREDPGETEALARDILIHVTSFFRDPAAFEALAEQVLPELLADKGVDSTVRVWVPGCSTGEEAYSLAICLVELVAHKGRAPAIKIFGSDLSEGAIEAARAGLYTESDVEKVSPERLARFFEREDGGYRIGRSIRDLCVFVRHDLTRDPPFARLDLISCRNVLIYFDAELQRRVLPLLHHCLNKPGYLLLGSSESIREFDDLFAPVDKEHRIYCKTGESPRIEFPLAFGHEAEARLPAVKPARRPRPARDAQRQADHILLARYAPSGVVVDERLQVVQYRGRTGDFLEAPPGYPQTNVIKMARQGLAGPLRDALETAQADSVSVRREGLRIAGDARARPINLDVMPLADFADAGERYFLVVFEESGESRDGSASPPVPAATPPPAVEEADEVARLRADLAATGDYLQAIAGEHQDTTEQLGAANEELLAANEELQSTNEELQSAQEELQATNEELTTLNDELQSRNRELDQVANDLVNVLESVQIPVIMVDHELRIRRFTPTAREVSSLLPGDVGRSIDDVKLKVEIDDLPARIHETIDSITPKELEVQGQDGRWFRLNIRPYRTADGRLDGAVLSFLDVDALKRVIEEAEQARDYAQGIVETVPMSLVVLDSSWRIVSANPPFYRGFALASSSHRPRLRDVAGGALDVDKLCDAIERSLAGRCPFQELQITCTFPGGDTRHFVVAGCPLQGAGGEQLLLLAIDDVTERYLLQASETQARLDAEQANRAKDVFLATLSHELRTPLSTILMSAQVLEKAAAQDSAIRRASAAIQRAVRNQARLIDDLLDISRIVSGKLMLDLQAVDFPAVVKSAVEVAQVTAEAKGIHLEIAIPESMPPVHGDPARLQQVVANLLHNAIKFTPEGGTVAVGLEAVEGSARLTVSDTGSGLPAELIPKLFQRFVQAESSMTRHHGGLGLGLAIVRHIADVHGGEVHAESCGINKGSMFTVTLPLAARDGDSTPVAQRTVTRSIRGVRVLLIEDDDDTREACISMLGDRGAEVRAARSSDEGLAILDSFLPQVILCDIAMPGHDGYAFISELRSRERVRNIPAAALTALASEDDRRRALESGFQLHLAKPIDSDRLATAVATLESWPHGSEPPPSPSAS
jgi:two-component system CheB/CheR fusion protein